MSIVEDFQKSVETLRLGKIRRLGCYTKPGDQEWVDIDNKFIAAAINLPSVRNVIIAISCILNRVSDISALRMSIEESQLK